MNVSSVGVSSYSAVDTASPSDFSATRTDASSTQFAAMLAGAIAPPPVETPAPSQAPRTSDLDQASDAEDTEETKPGSRKTDRASTDAPSAAYAAGRALMDKFGAVSGLDPALKDKLARVVSRMQNEHGRTVTVAEGLRSQARQDQLYAQGRTTDGPVVTWTRNSLHSEGRAADLKIDGGYDDPTGFAMLRKIAEEEGLHTLGARDPGHVELPTAGRAALDAVAGTPSTGTIKLAASLTPVATAVARPAIVAAVSPIARVANVAATATVATVAEPGVGSRGSGGAGSHSAGTNDKSSDSRRGLASNASSAIKSNDGADAYNSLSRSHTARGADDTAFSSVPAADGSTAAARADQIMDLQDSAGAKTLSRLSLSLDDGRGGQDQVRIGMNGNTVGASFTMSDATGADRISSRLGELTRALEKQGLEPQAFQVRSTSSTRDADVGSIRLGTVSARLGVDSTNTRQDGRSDTNANTRQRSNQQNDQQQESAQNRSDDRRRRSTIFSLAGEDK